eukprot:3368724-Rhodomonas_salina.1
MATCSPLWRLLLLPALPPDPLLPDDDRSGHVGALTSHVRWGAGSGEADHPCHRRHQRHRRCRLRQR